MAKKIIAIVNQKGGVGKTTTTINVAAQLATLNKNILLIDLDPQGNATSGIGIEKESLNLTTYDLLCNMVPVKSIVQQTHVAKLMIIPSNSNLAGAEISLVDNNNREFGLGKTISSIENEFDYILIDCPPSLGLLTINALTAADMALIPVQAEYYALEGLSQLLNTIQAVKQSTNPNLELLGIVLTMYDKRTSLSEQVREEIKKYFGDSLFKNHIPRNIRLAEAPSFGQTIFEHDKWSKGARAYKSLTREIADRLQS